MTVHGTVLVQCAFRFQTAIDLFDIIFQEKVIGFHECLPTVFQTKKSVPYFLGCNKAVALHDFLIMPCDSCAELVEQPVGSRAVTLFPTARPPLTPQSVGSMETLQLNYACVLSTVMRPMMGDVPSFLTLSFFK